jgi:hypothetical protein
VTHPNEDVDARWTIKFSKAKPAADGRPRIDIAIPSFGYKSHISIDRRQEIIRRPARLLLRPAQSMATRIDRDRPLRRDLPRKTSLGGYTDVDIDDVIWNLNSGAAKVPRLPHVYQSFRRQSRCRTWKVNPTGSSNASAAYRSARIRSEQA